MNVAAKNKRGKRRPVAEINVVPYIDVMLVLLVIFMITAPLLNQGVKVDLPQAAAQAIPKEQQEPIIVSVDSTGNYYLNIAATPEQPIAPEEIVTRVAAELQLANQNGGNGSQSRQVLVKGDKSVDYGKVVQAMVLLQRAGAATVGLMTSPAAP